MLGEHMESDTVTNRGGRPKISVDWDQVDAMCEIHCTGEEQAYILGISYDTLNLRCHEDHGVSFPEYFSEKSAIGKQSLRRKQYSQAMDGDRGMLDWLGKQWLGQTDDGSRGERKQEPITINIIKPDGVD